MKKILILLLAFTMLFSSVLPVNAATKDKTPPSVKTTNPANNNYNVKINATIMITFSENILKGNAYSNITVKDQNDFEVDYKIRIINNVLSIKTISNLEYYTKYTIDIPIGAIKDKSGNSLKKAVKLIFRTQNSTAIIKSTPVPTPVPTEERLSTKDIAKKANSVVYIEVKDSKNEVYATGSGFLVDNKIITNYHVIDGAGNATITTNEGKVYNVTGVFAYDITNDLAILQIDGEGLPAVTLGDSDKISIGEAVVAIGSPVGLQNTVSEGIISSLRKGSSYSIQISVPISHGSSGGALFNEYGDVIGITSAGIETTGDLNFAIPINLVKPLLKSNTIISLQELYNKVHVIIYADAKYEGDIINGIPNGYGTMTFDNGDVYNGNWVNGQRNGQGTYCWANGDKYVGDFVNGVITGQGTYNWTNGDKYIGEFKNDKRNGQGTYYYTNGTTETGTWADNVLITPSTSSDTATVNRILFESEPNSLFANSNSLPMGNFITGYISDEYDMDTYKIEVPDSGYYDIWSQIGSNGLFCNKYFVALFDSNNKYITVATTQSFTAKDGTLSYSNFLYKYYLSSGTYYIMILPKKDGFFSGMESLKYSLIFEKST